MRSHRAVGNLQIVVTAAMAGGGCARRATIIATVRAMSIATATPTPTMMSAVRAAVWSPLCGSACKLRENKKSITCDKHVSPSDASKAFHDGLSQTDCYDLLNAINGMLSKLFAKKED